MRFILCLASASIFALIACSSDEPVPTLSSQATPTSPPAASTAAPSATSAPVPTPACNGTLTPPQTEGPYFKAGSPERKSLIEVSITGTRLVLSGLVLSRDCKPVAGAKVDFWQADADGAYDNTGFKLRGHQFTDAEGKYRLETVYPGLYPGRTRHIHVMISLLVVSLTTQLYFPSEPRNATDGIFDQGLLTALQDTQDGKIASYNFVLNTN